MKSESAAPVLRDVARMREIDRMKADLVSSVSHKLRTPLTSIKAYTVTILGNHNMTEETRRKYLDKRWCFTAAEAGCKISHTTQSGRALIALSLPRLSLGRFLFQNQSPPAAVNSSRSVSNSSAEVVRKVRFYCPIFAVSLRFRTRHSLFRVGPWH